VVDALSVRLFLRTNRTVELTEDSARFLPHARELIRAADAALAALGADHKPLHLDVIDYRLSPSTPQPRRDPTAFPTPITTMGCAPWSRHHEENKR
jgi:DNA-binding transcriptional LysR family regulator